MFPGLLSILLFLLFGFLFTLTVWLCVNCPCSGSVLAPVDLFWVTLWQERHCNMYYFMLTDVVCYLGGPLKDVFDLPIFSKHNMFVIDLLTVFPAHLLYFIIMTNRCIMFDTFTVICLPRTKWGPLLTRRGSYLSGALKVVASRKQSTAGTGPAVGPSSGIRRTPEGG